MNPREAMISVMADIIHASNDYDNDRLNDPAVWQHFMEEVLARMEDHPDGATRRVLDEIDRDQFQQWIDSPLFWGDLNQELERRGQVLMTLLPSEHQGRC